MKKIFSTLVLLMLCLQGFSQKETIDSLVEQKQKLNLVYTSLYKENSEMSYTSPGGEIGAPAKYIINGKLTTTYMLFGPRNLPIAFTVNPDFTVRVRTDQSAGVRTPSFRLGGTFYVRLATEMERYKYFQLGFTHHSNGQDGEAILKDGSINTKTGNFSTNYLTAAYSFGNFSEQKLSATSAYSYHHKVGLEWHKWFNYEPALNGDYGFTRLNYDISFRINQFYNGQKGGWKRVSSRDLKSNNSLQKEVWRFNGKLSYAVNKYENQDFFGFKRRLNIETSANYSLPFMQNVFIMASFGYYGEDPYNIYFKDRYAFMRFGVSSTFSSYKLK